MSLAQASEDFACVHLWFQSAHSPRAVNAQKIHRPVQIPIVT
jgi:hypothetical protein